MYTSSDFISVTDIRKNISWVMTLLRKDKEKIIFKNNKPTAVLVDFSFYEQLHKNNNLDIEPIYWSNAFIWTKDHKKLMSLMKDA